MDCLFGIEFSGRNQQGQRVMGLVAAKVYIWQVIIHVGLLVDTWWNKKGNLDTMLFFKF